MSLLTSLRDKAKELPFLASPDQEMKGVFVSSNEVFSASGRSISPVGFKLVVIGPSVDPARLRSLAEKRGTYPIKSRRERLSLRLFGPEQDHRQMHVELNTPEWLSCCIHGIWQRTLSTWSTWDTGGSGLSMGRGSGHQGQGRSFLVMV